MIPFGKVEVITSKFLRSSPWLGLPLWNICVTTDHRYVPLVVSTSRSFPHSWLITCFATRLARRVPLVEHKLLTLLEHLSSLPGFSGVRGTRSLVLYVCFVDRCLYFFFWPLCCLFFFDIRILITTLLSSNSSYWWNKPEYPSTRPATSHLQTLSYNVVSSTHHQLFIVNYTSS
jgi:hypothetical protein